MFDFGMQLMVEELTTFDNGGRSSAAPSAKPSPNYPVLIRAALPGLLCELICSEFDLEPRAQRSYQGMVDPARRDCTFYFPTPTLSDAASAFVLASVQAITEVQPRPTYAPVVYRYPVGVGFVLHHDEVTDIERERAATNNQPVIGGDLSCSVTLSDQVDYAGGAFLFPDFNLSLQPERGDLIVFPATRQFMHEITPIQFGARYSLLVRLDLGG